MTAGRRMKTNPYLSPCTKLNSKQIKNLNIPDTMNHIKEKVGYRLELKAQEKPEQDTNSTSIKTNS